MRRRALPCIDQSHRRLAQRLRTANARIDGQVSEHARYQLHRGFPPLLDVDLALRLLRPQRLLNAARINGVRHIIAGHLHRNQINTYSNVEVICTGSGSSTGAGELHGNWMYGLDVEVNGHGTVSISKQPFQYNAAEASFME